MAEEYSDPVAYPRYAHCYLPAQHRSSAAAVEASDGFAQFSLERAAVFISFGQSSWSLSKMDAVDSMVWA